MVECGRLSPFDRLVQRIEDGGLQVVAIHALAYLEGGTPGISWQMEPKGSEGTTPRKPSEYLALACTSHDQ